MTWVWILLAVGVVVALAWSRARQAGLRRRAPAPLPAKAPDLVGVTGTVIAGRLGYEGGRVRVRDRSGQVLELPARLGEGEEPLEEGAEVLVIDNPHQGGALTVVPSDLPALEDLSS